MEAGSDLVHVVRSTHAPLPVVVLEQVVAVRKLGGVPVSLIRFEAVGAVNRRGIVEVNVVLSLGWAETQVVETGRDIFPEASGGREEQRRVGLRCQVALLTTART